MEKKSTRREFLKSFGAAVGGVIVCGTEVLAQEAKGVTLAEIIEPERYRLFQELKHFDPVPLRARAGSGSYHGTIQLLHGTLNGQKIVPYHSKSGEVPIIAVAPGETIYGRLTGILRHKHEKSAAFPVGYVAHWVHDGKKLPAYGAAMKHQLQDPASEGGQRIVAVLPRKEQENGNRVVTAPKKAGTYYLSGAGAAYSGKTLDERLQRVFSSTNNQFEKPVWGNGYDVTDWDTSETLHTMKYGNMFSREPLAQPDKDTGEIEGLARYAAFSVRILVDPRVMNTKKE
jgi:hypothetical protein